MIRWKLTNRWTNTSPRHWKGRTSKTQPNRTDDGVDLIRRRRNKNEKKKRRGRRKSAKECAGPSTRISAVACVNLARRFAASREYRSPWHVDSIQSSSEMLYLFARCIKFCLSLPPTRHALAEFFSISSTFPPLFSPFRSFFLSCAMVRARLTLNWIRSSQRYRFTLTAEKCRSCEFKRDTTLALGTRRIRERQRNSTSLWRKRYKKDARMEAL